MMGDPGQVACLVCEDIWGDVNGEGNIVVVRMCALSIYSCPCGVLGFVFRRARGAKVCFYFLCLVFRLLEKRVF